MRPYNRIARFLPNADQWRRLDADERRHRDFAAVVAVGLLDSDENDEADGYEFLGPAQWRPEP